MTEPRSEAAPFDQAGFWVIAVVAAGVSVALTGFLFGIANNSGHLSVAARLYDEPQFAHDAFIQSMRYFASGFWQLLAGVARHVDARRLFFALHCLSRLIAFVGFLACADVIGVRTRRQRILFSALLCITPLLRDHAYAGQGAVFVNNFAHSEMANGIALLVLYLLARRKIAWALIFNGVVFFINVLMAVWNAGPLVVEIVPLAVRRRVPGFTRQLVLGLLVGGALAAPVLRNILSNRTFGRPLGFDYREFLGQYYGGHSLFQPHPLDQKVGILLVAILGLVSLSALGHEARSFFIALGVYVMMYAVGIVLPDLTHSPMALNLQFIRLGVMFHLLAALGAAALATRWLTGADMVRRHITGPVLALFVGFEGEITSPLVLGALGAASLTVLASRWVIDERLPSLRTLAPRLPFGIAVMVCLTISTALFELDIVQSNAGIAGMVDEWTTLSRWVRGHTPENAVFLVPTYDYSLEAPRAMIHYNELEGTLGSPLFEFEAQRSVWVDFKRGTAVMWRPDYYSTWWPRVSKLLLVSSLPGKIDFAARNGVNYVIAGCEARMKFKPIYRTERLCLFDVARAKAG